MLTNVADIVIAGGLEELKSDLIAKQQALRIRDTGASANSLRVEVVSDDNTVAGQLHGFQRWKYQNDGHGPTPSGKPSREMVAEIREWVKRRGIPEKAAYPIAAKIAREGTKVPNPHNPGGLVTDILNAENVREKLSPRLREAVFKELRSTLFNR